MVRKIKNAGNIRAHYLREIMEVRGIVHGFTLVRREGTICFRDLGKEVGMKEGLGTE